MTAIASLTLNKFRGVVDELSLSFVKNGKPASVLLVGDNGSGKSSIIDAIEFCLQGNVYQRRLMIHQYRHFATYTR
jgi:DNA repair exonuclease SbcCD ATPase subunit